MLALAGLVSTADWDRSSASMKSVTHGVMAGSQALFVAGGCSSAKPSNGQVEGGQRTSEASAAPQEDLEKAVRGLGTCLSGSGMTVVDSGWDSITRSAYPAVRDRHMNSPGGRRLCSNRNGRTAPSTTCNVCTRECPNTVASEWRLSLAGLRPGVEFLDMGMPRRGSQHSTFGWISKNGNGVRHEEGRKNHGLVHAGHGPAHRGHAGRRLVGSSASAHTVTGGKTRSCGTTDRFRNEHNYVYTNKPDVSQTWSYRVPD